MNKKIASGKQTVDRHKTTRREIYELAANRHRKAVAATQARKSKVETVPVEMSQKGTAVFDVDEMPRADMSVEAVVYYTGELPLPSVAGYAAATAATSQVFVSPSSAIRKLLNHINMCLDTLDFVDLNEASSCQTLVNGTELGWEHNRDTVSGDTTAHGSPYGAGRARVFTTLKSDLRNRGLKTEMSHLCPTDGRSEVLAIQPM